MLRDEFINGSKKYLVLPNWYKTSTLKTSKATGENFFKDEVEEADFPREFCSYRKANDSIAYQLFSILELIYLGHDHASFYISRDCPTSMSECK